MKTIGIIGGMSWESTALYYQHINRLTREHFGGGLHSAKVLMHSLNMAEIAAKQKASEWEELASILSDSASKLERIGADCILIATNTMHKIAPEISQTINIPIIHIATATANAINKAKIKKVGLLGTKFTMEQSFYREILNQHGIEVIIPNDQRRDQIHHIIFQELCCGIFNQDSKLLLQESLSELEAAGATGIVLGCTELILGIDQQHPSLAIFDTTEIHARSAVEFATQS